MRIARILALFLCIVACASSQSPMRSTKTYRAAPGTWFVCHGDSITEGYGTTGWRTSDHYAYPYLTTQLASSLTFGMVQLGISGQGFNYVYPVYPSSTFPNLTVDAVNRVDPILSQTGSKYLIIFAGTNDIFLNGTSGANTWTLAETYINARISAGWTIANVCVGTMLPRQNAHESDRTAYNNAIRSNAAGMGYKVCDFAANTTIGEAGDENNPTYYLDTIHPNDAGHAILAQIVKDTLFP